MENENQNPKLSLDDIFEIKNEICNSVGDYCMKCPFNASNLCTSLTDVLDSKDKIESICTEWENKKPTLAEKINEILKPYGMKLMDSNHYIWFDDNYTGVQTKDRLVNKLYTTKWKGEPNA